MNRSVCQWFRGKFSKLKQTVQFFYLVPAKYMFHQNNIIIERLLFSYSTMGKDEPLSTRINEKENKRLLKSNRF